MKVSTYIRTVSSILLAGVLATSTAVAQKSTVVAPSYDQKLSNNLSGDAKSAFVRATSLFEVGNFDAARVEFEQAHALSADARVLYNVAVCDKELGRYARAIATLKESLEQRADRLPLPYTRRVKATIQALEPFVTTMTIAAQVEGAAVLVDDEEVGRTPLTGLSVDVGEHIVRLAKPGYHGTPVRIKARSGQTVHVDLTMEKLAQKELITVLASGMGRLERAEVLIDDVSVGETPWSGQVDVGQRRVTLRAQGHAPRTRTVDVRAGSRPTLTISLREYDLRGRLRVRTTNADNTISLNGRVVGRGDFSGRVSPGEHTLRVTRPGADPYTVDFVIRPQEARSMNVTLDESGSISPWVWIAGGVVVAGATTATIMLANRETQYDGQTPGTLPPRIVPTSHTFRGF